MVRYHQLNEIIHFKLNSTLFWCFCHQLNFLNILFKLIICFQSFFFLLLDFLSSGDLMSCFHGDRRIHQFGSKSHCWQNCHSWQKCHNQEIWRLFISVLLSQSGILKTIYLVLHIVFEIAWGSDFPAWFCWHVRHWFWILGK